MGIRYFARYTSPNLPVPSDIPSLKSLIVMARRFIVTGDLTCLFIVVKSGISRFSICCFLKAGTD